MNYIYTNNRNNRKYILNPEINMGTKVCLTDMATCEDKFVAVSTLKRNYSRCITEDTYVELKAFTGMFIGICKVYSNDGVMTVWTKAGKPLEFNAEGKQINAKNPRFANKLGIDYSYSELTLKWALS